MAKRLSTRIQLVREAINEQLRREYQGLNHVGRGLQREGFVGGYLQALSDVQAAINKCPVNNSRFEHYWESQP